MRLFGRLFRETGGATALEYGLIVAMLAVASILVFTAVGSEMSAVISTVSSHLL